jgi:sugar phosphate isomerase/epimerase
MKTGLSTLFLLGKKSAEMYSFFEEVGGQCKVWEIVDEGHLKLNLPLIKRLLELSSSYGFEYTVHAPYTDLNIASLNPYARKVSLKCIENSIKNACKLQAKLLTFHPGFKGALEAFYPKKAQQINIESLRYIMSKAKDLDVSVSIENMLRGVPAIPATVEGFEEIFSNPEFHDLGLTLDVGHAHTTTQLNLFLEKLGHKITNVHLHDNDGINDLHLGLGEGSLEWKSIIKSLKTSRFSGYVIIESIQKAYESFLELNAFLNHN